MVSFLVAANYHRVDLPEDWKASRAQFEPFAFPEGVVLGFRAIFWKAFTAVHSGPVSGELMLADHRWRLKEMVVLESRDARSRLGLSDDDLVFVVMRIECDGAPADYDLNAAIFRARMNEQAFVGAIIAGLSDDPGLQWLNTLKHDREFPGRYILRHKPEYGTGVEVLAMFAFHYFGLLIFWQVARDQVEITLSPDPLSMERNGADLLSLRQRIINLDRLFLTSSVSNHPELRALSRDCRERQKIEKRFLRLPELNERIEKYFEIVSQFAVQREQRMLNAVVLVIALLGLPISVMSMMLAMSTQAEVVVRPDRLFGALGVQTFLIASLVGSGLALGSLAVLLTSRTLANLGRRATRRLRRVWV